MDFPTLSSISKVHFRIYSDKFCLFLAGNSYEELSIDYEKRETGCSLVWWKGREKSTKNLEDVDFLHVASGDVQKVLENQTSILEEFAVVILYKFDEAQNSIQSAMKMFMKIEEILKSRKTPLQVQNLNITGIDEDQVMRILPQVDPRFLTRLTINNAKEPNQQMDREKLCIEKIRKTEQFANTKELAVMGFFIEPVVENLKGFRCVQVAFEEVTNELFRVIRQKVLQSPNVEYIQIRFSELDLEVEKSLETSYGLPSGETDQLGHKRRQWFLSTKDYRKVESIIVFRDNILLSVIEREKVFEGAKIV